MKLSSRLAVSISGYGFVLNQFIVPCLEYTSQKRETCLLLKSSPELLVRIMVKTVYTDGGPSYQEASNVLI